MEIQQIVEQNPWWENKEKIKKTGSLPCFYQKNQIVPTSLRRRRPKDEAFDETFPEE